ncbi:MAG: hypothetical protein LUD82_08000, partial [Clostridiales bacterium]|nr:hypothetical protein [Clostridiales bacterium]
AARIAKDSINALFQQALHHDLCASHFHRIGIPPLNYAAARQVQQEAGHKKCPVPSLGRS